MLFCVKSRILRKFFLGISVFCFSLLFINFCNGAARSPQSPKGPQGAVIMRTNTPGRFSPIRLSHTPDIAKSNTPAIEVIFDSPDIIVDHDCGVDDVISCLLQMKYSIIKQRRLMRHYNIKPVNFRVRAFTISPADSYREPAAWVMKRLVNLVLPDASFQIPIGVGLNAGANPFPPDWREDAWKLTQLGIWGAPVSRDAVFATFSEGIYPPLQVLINVLSDVTAPVDILETGPCTNLAELFENRPDLISKINRVYMMGGAVHVDGNVKEHPGDHDGTAEWNIYNNPQAFKTLLESGVPITLISLDATRFTPIRKEFQEELKAHISQKPFRFVSESLHVIQFLIDIGQYMFWDTLTSAVTINPNIIRTEKTKINVKLDGPSKGKTFVDVENGYEVDLAVWADQAMFEHTVREILALKR